MSRSLKTNKTYRLTALPVKYARPIYISSFTFRAYGCGRACGGVYYYYYYL